MGLNMGIHPAKPQYEGKKQKRLACDLLLCTSSICQVIFKQSKIKTTGSIKEVKE